MHSSAKYKNSTGIIESYRALKLITRGMTGLARCEFNLRNKAKEHTGYLVGGSFLFAGVN